ncbi:MAG: DUF998 domain-containing protein [Paracoccaceae bacterium]
MTDRAENKTHAERPELLMAMAALGAAGVVALVVGVLWAQAAVPGHDWVADTISDLGAGELEWIMDFGLYAFASGLAGLSVAAAHAHLGGRRWSWGVICLLILAGLVMVIGARDEYGDDDPGGVVIHMYLVYGLGVFFTIMPLLLATGLDGWPRRALIGLGVLWLASSPVFFALPDDVDGLYERALGVVAGAQVLVLSWLFWRRGRAS